MFGSQQWVIHRVFRKIGKSVCYNIKISNAIVSNDYLEMDESVEQLKDEFLPLAYAASKYRYIELWWPLTVISLLSDMVSKPIKQYRIGCSDFPLYSKSILTHGE